MKISKIEKFVISLIIILTCFWCFSIYSCVKIVKHNGGIENVIIDAGKEIKHIKSEIEKE